MSRIGRKQISLPEKVEINIQGGGGVSVKGPKGQLHWNLPGGINLEQEGGTLTVVRSSEEREVRAMHGTARSLVANMIEGVVKGFTRELEIIGVGFRAAVKGNALDLSLGFSHPVLHPIPEGITVTVEGNTNIKIEGIDKQLVGQFAADVRSYYPPEPYKGKGVRYKGERVRRKQGKSVKR
ncbi:MAG: large subunit ribosomal protein L6 [Verrucomicrobia bacterium]|jgi:large subunit ribosomal protein L6|nr:50S ribosomal protein L6 [Verrucomicrobiales bacterium]RFC42010.1 MAG: large subunit ribosomal protein L6 [Verrucomicrobiota bacterium]